MPRLDEMVLKKNNKNSINFILFFFFLISYSGIKNYNVYLSKCNPIVNMKVNLPDGFYPLVTERYRNYLQHLRTLQTIYRIPQAKRYLIYLFL